MKKSVRMISFLLLGGIWFTFVLAGCASFPGKELHSYSYADIVPPAKKVAIDYDATFLTLGKENAGAVKIFQEEIEKVFNQSNQFSKFNAGAGFAKYHFSLSLRNDANVGLASLSGFISGLSLFIIPTYATDEYTLTVDVKKGNEVVKHYEYKDSMRTWTEALLIFLTPTHFPTSVVKDVIDNMLLNFLHDMEKDHLLL